MNILGKWLVNFWLIDILWECLFKLKFGIKASIIIFSRKIIIIPLILILYLILQHRWTIVLFSLILLEILKLFIKTMRAKLLIFRPDPTRRRRRFLNTFIKIILILANLWFCFEMQAHLIQRICIFYRILMKLSWFL
jgi:hypothetical protein